jgi:hypothetical protein
MPVFLHIEAHARQPLLSFGTLPIKIVIVRSLKNFTGFHSARGVGKKQAAARKLPPLGSTVA